MKRPLVSVVIPTKNRAELVEGAVKSALAQTYPELEVIVVDDGSTDATGEVFVRLEGDPRVQTCRNPSSRGAAAARNEGAELAQGALLLFEDDDCRGEPHRVDTLVSALEAAPEAAYAFCRSRRKTASGESITKGQEGPWSIGTPGALIRASAFREVGGFDPSLPRLQDFDLWTRLLARWRAVEVPDVLYEAGYDDQGMSASPHLLLQAEVRLAEKYANSGLPRRHLAAMHRRLGGMLLVAGFWRRGLFHVTRALRRCPLSPRSWVAFAGGLAGPPVYRMLVAGARSIRGGP